MIETETHTPLAVDSPEFCARADCQERILSASLEGTADVNVKRALDDFLVKLHEAARAQRATEVVMDFRKLKFMNSSCLKGLVSWICTVQGLAPQSQYRIVLVSSPELHWLRRSLRALWSLATELVTIQT